MTTLSNAFFDTYISAYEHAQRHSRCAHVACGILIDDRLVEIRTNTPSLHAEMESISSLAAVVRKRERGVHRSNSDTIA